MVKKFYNYKYKVSVSQYIALKNYVTPKEEKVFAMMWKNIQNISLVLSPFKDQLLYDIIWRNGTTNAYYALNENERRLSYSCV